MASDPASKLENYSTNQSSTNQPVGNKKAKLISHLTTHENAWKEKIVTAHFAVACKAKQQNDIFNLEAQSLNLLAQTGATNMLFMIMNQDLSNLDADLREFFALKKINPQVPPQKHQIWICLTSLILIWSCFLAFLAFFFTGFTWL